MTMFFVIVIALYNSVEIGFHFSTIVAPVRFLTVRSLKWMSLAYAIVLTTALVYFAIVWFIKRKEYSTIDSQRTLVVLAFLPLVWLLFVMFDNYEDEFGRQKDTFEFYAINHFAVALISFFASGIIQASHTSSRKPISGHLWFVVLVFLLLGAALLFSLVLGFITFAEVIDSEVANSKAMWIMSVTLMGVLLMAFIVHIYSPHLMYQTSIFSSFASMVLLVAVVLYYIEFKYDYNSNRDASLQVAAQPVPLTEGVPWTMINAVASVIFFFIAIVASLPIATAVSNYGKDPSKPENWLLIAEIVLAIGSFIAGIVVAAFCIIWLIPGNTNGIDVQQLFWVAVGKIAWDFAMLVVALVGAIVHGTIKGHTKRIWLALMTTVMTGVVLGDAAYWWDNNEVSDTREPGWKTNALYCAMLNLVGAFTAGQLVSDISFQYKERM